MYEKRTLPNGVRMVYEHMPHVRSAAIGVWIGVGSRYESPSNAGSAHFIEHMLFKGTEKRSAFEISDSTEKALKRICNSGKNIHYCNQVKINHSMSDNFLIFYK